MHFAVLFSLERGLFAYYPVVGLVLALGAAIRRTRIWTGCFALTLGLYVALYGYWHCWNLGGSFGYRGIVEALPPAIVLFAASLEALARKSRVAITVLAGICVVATMQLMIAGYWHHGLADDSRAHELYWRHLVGKRSIFRPFY
jgi:hypothetical protein